MWPISAGGSAPDPWLAVEHDPAADAGAPEDAEQRAVGTARAERELGVGRDLDVVAEPDLGPERLRQRRGEREAAFPIGQIARARHIAAVDRARGADAHAGERRRLDAGLLGGLAQRRLHLGGDIFRAAARRRRAASRAEHLVIVVDDHRLDLRAAKVDAAVGRHRGGSSQTPPASSAAARRLGERPRRNDLPLPLSPLEPFFAASYSRA